MKTAVIYKRVSTEEQTKGNRHSLDAQEEICKEFARKPSIPNEDIKKLKVLKIFSDEGKSASTTNRAGLQAMLDYCSEHKVDYVLVQDTDRLARDVEGHILIKSSLAKCGSRVISISQPGLDDSAEGRMVDMIIASVNQFQLDQTRRKTRKGIEEKIRKGGWATQAPLGYLNVTKANDEKVIEVDPKMGPIVTELFELYATGSYSVQDILEIGTEKGLRSSRGNPLPHSSMAALLSNTAYIGHVFYGDLYNEKGAHKPLVSQEIFDQVQQIKNARTTRGCKDIKHFFLLRGFVTCDNCKRRFTAEHHFKKNKSYYHCTRRGTNCKDKFVEMNKLEAMVFNRVSRLRFSDEFIDNVVKKVELNYKEQKSEDDTKRQALQNELNAITHKIDLLDNKYLESKIDDADYNRMSEKIKKLQSEKQVELATLRKQKHADTQILEDVMKAAQRFPELYKDLSPEMQKEYLALFIKEIKVSDEKIRSIEFTPYLEAILSKSKAHFIAEKPKKKLQRSKVVS